MTLINLDFLAHYGPGLQDEDCTANLIRRGEHDLEEWGISCLEAIEMNPLNQDDRAYKLPDGIMLVAT